MKKHLPFVILFIILALYLGLKTLPEDGWSGWGIFSAQTLLSAQHWAKDGFIQNKFLFIPIGYSKIVQYLDNPEMRQHARGTTTGGLIGKRLYYTHYPSGYLFPYALLMKLGVTERHWFRLLALLFSLIALILMYWFFNLILALRSPMLQGEGGSTPLIAFIATLYYGISTMFLDYADSLANQPIDDLFRFAILVLSVLAIQKAVGRLGPGQTLEEVSSAKAAPPSREIAPSLPSFWTTIVIWFLYFFLSLSSYDSTFFILIWLVGLDLITYQKFLWKRWLFFASAPILAFVLQLFQNYWYFGNWREVWLDVKGSFFFRADAGPGRNFLEKHIRSMFSPLSYLTALRVRFILPLIIFLAVGFIYFKNKLTERLAAGADKTGKSEAINWFDNNAVSTASRPTFRYFSLLIVAGLAYAFVFVSSGYFPYQGRQWAPWLALLVSISVILIIKFWSLWRRGAFNKIEKILIVVFLLIPLLVIWSAQISRTAVYVKNWPNNRFDQKTIGLYKSLRQSISGEAVVFKIDVNSKEDYPQADPREEYYAGHAILSFKNFQDLMRDYLWLKRHVDYPWTAIVVSPTKELTEGFSQIFNLSGEIKLINDNYIFIVSP